MSDMIERVARAIALAALDDETRSVVDPENWPVAESYCDMARAAIEAMRVPVADMLQGEPCMYQGKSYMVPVMYIWPKMIDAALSEKP